MRPPSKKWIEEKLNQIFKQEARHTVHVGMLADWAHASILVVCGNLHNSPTFFRGQLPFGFGERCGAMDFRMKSTSKLSEGADDFVGVIFSLLWID